MATTIKNPSEESGNTVSLDNKEKLLLGKKSLVNFVLVEDFFRNIRSSERVSKKLRNRLISSLLSPYAEFLMLSKNSGDLLYLSRLNGRMLNNEIIELRKNLSKQLMIHFPGYFEEQGFGMYRGNSVFLSTFLLDFIKGNIVVKTMRDKRIFHTLDRVYHRWLRTINFFVSLSSIVPGEFSSREFKELTIEEKLKIVSIISKKNELDFFLIENKGRISRVCNICLLNSRALTTHHLIPSAFFGKFRDELNSNSIANPHISKFEKSNFHKNNRKNIVTVCNECHHLYLEPIIDILFSHSHLNFADIILIPAKLFVFRTFEKLIKNFSHRPSNFISSEKDHNQVLYNIAKLSGILVNEEIANLKILDSIKKHEV